MNTNVLIVDDVPENLTAIEAIIGTPDITVLKAQSGVDALELLLEYDVALALIDVQMPGMDGFELAGLIRGSERTRSIPLIFLTAGAGDSEKFFRGYDAGAVDFLFKPVDANVLRGKVNVFVELYGQRIQLAAQLEKLRQALKLNDMFTAVLGHDLRNPLAAVMNGAALLQKTSSDERVLATAGRIKLSGERMVKMVGQLLDVARIRSQGLTLSVESADYGQLCRRIVDELNPVAAGRSIIFEQSGAAHGELDTDRFAQVMSNLVGNALQHGQPDVPVRVRLDGEDARTIVISIRNGGVIPPELIPGLFEPGGSIQGRPARQGLGLGLYIVKCFVLAHGGDVVVDSSEHDGTEFRVTMPRGVNGGRVKELVGITDV